MSVSVPSDAPKPRQCHVKKWEDFNGYGFNLHAEKGKHGHHIGALDPGSPAEAAGIKEGDRIVEVNGTNIANENHQQVVSRIRAVANEVKLLVVDSATDDYYRERKIVVRGDMAGVVNITTPASKAVYDADPMAGYAAAAAATTDEAEPQPRLAKLRTWPDFQGYGFNLTTEKNKPGQYIGKVDSESPASTAGVREGDRIIEVNGVNVTEETHHQVVNRIKARPGQVDLLLADKPTDLYYAGLGTVIRGDMPQVHTQETPESSKDVPPPTPPPAVPDDVTPEEAAVVIAAVAAAAETLPAEEAAVVQAAVVEEAAQEELKAAVEEVTEEEAAATVAAVAIVAAEAEATETEAAIVEAAIVEAAVVPEPQAAPEPEPAQAPEQDLLSPMEAAEAVAAVAVVAAAVEVAAVESDAPRPRLCHVRKWPTFQGYGFTLNAGGPKGHFIGNADAGSPAAAAGLRKDDKIIEVNGSSIVEDDHKAVIGKITADPTEVKLLVADEATEAYYKDKKIKIHSNMSEVELIVCPLEEPTAAEVAAAVEVAAEVAAEVAEAEVAVAAVTAVAVAAAVEAEPEVGPSPRLCHLKRWSDFQGYGFNLNAEKGRVGNFIGAVDKDSPAEAAGVQTGDNIVEVNGDDVEAASHGQVVGKITSDKTQVKLLLVDAATHDYYTEKGIKISSSLPSVKVIVCPESNPGAAAVAAAVHTNGVAEVKVDQKPVYEPEPYRNSQPAPAQGDALGGSSLQEALSRVKSRKKPKAGTGNLSMKEKFELFQQL